MSTLLTGKSSLVLLFNHLPILDYSCVIDDLSNEDPIQSKLVAGPHPSFLARISSVDKNCLMGGMCTSFAITKCPMGIMCTLFGIEYSQIVSCLVFSHCA